MTTDILKHTRAAFVRALRLDAILTIVEIGSAISIGVTIGLLVGGAL